MPIIDRIKLPSGNIYILADSDAQSKLENVYTKSETYTRAEVLAAIAEAMKGGYLAVNTLPTASENTLGHIYLVPDPDGSGDNVRIEYVTVQSGSSYTWEKLGTTELNLDNLTLEKGDGDMVLGEGTTFTASQPPVDISGGTSDTFVKSYPGQSGKLETTTVPNVTGNASVSIPNVTSVGSASTWNFAMGTGNEATTLIISGGNGAAPTLGSALEASKVTLGDAKTVATGGVSAGGGGSDVMTGLGTAVTGTAVTNVGTAALRSAPAITVGTNDKVKVAKYDDLELQKP